jgi:peptidoglycan hydrolase-like protein with peptidoglycan-binding domain
VDAKTYNRTRFGIGYTLRQLPERWEGAEGLRAFDVEGDVELSERELRRVDWAEFTAAVRRFQQSQGFAAADLDGKLGPRTLRALAAAFPASAAGVVLRLGDLDLPAATEPLAPAPPDRVVGETGTAERKAVARLWNSYGSAIVDGAGAADIAPEVALAIFAVESKRAYDPTTGLVIVRFEPKVFLRRSGRLVTADHASQLSEWRSLEKAYALDPIAALESASYGLPQLMGFNFRVTVHPDARSLLLAFQRSAREQVAGFFGFVTANRLAPLARRADFVGFARRYNGIGKEQLYAAKIRRYLGFARKIV